MKEHRIDRLLNALTRPVFVWQMARYLALRGRYAGSGRTDSLGKSAQTRYRNATEAAESLVRDWVRTNPAHQQLAWCIECDTPAVWIATPGGTGGTWLHTLVDHSTTGHDAAVE